MAKWWRVCTYSVPPISEVEVVAETECFITVRETMRATGMSRDSRNAKLSRTEAFFPTWEEAHAWLVRVHRERVEHATQDLARASNALGVVMGIKP